MRSFLTPTNHPRHDPTEATDHGVADRREMLRGSGAAFAAKFCGSIVQYVYAILIARVLGASDAGTYFFAVTVVTAASTFGRLGVEHGVLRLGSAMTAQASWAEIRRLVRHALLFAWATTGTISVVGLLASAWLAPTVFRTGDVGLIRIFLLAAPALASLQVAHDALRAVGKVGVAAVFSFVVLPLTWVCGWLVAIVFLDPLTGAAVAFVGGIMLTAGVTFNHLYRRLPRGSAGHEHDLPSLYDNWRTILQKSWPLILPAVWGSLITWTDTIVVGFVATRSDVAIYVAAAKTATYVLASMTAIQLALAPITANRATFNDPARLVSLAREASRYALALAFPAATLILLLSPYIMSLFGPDFLAGTATLSLLTVGQLAMVTAGAGRYLLMWGGAPVSVFRLTALFFIYEIIVGIGGGLLYGHTGVALANLTGSLGFGFAIAYVAKARFSSWILPFRFGRLIAVTALAALVYLPAYELAGVVVATALFVTIVVVGTLRWILTPSESDFLMRCLPSFLRRRQAGSPAPRR